MALSYSFDTRVSAWAPETGTAFRIGAAYERLLIGDELAQNGSDAFGVSARALEQVQVGLRHQLSLRAAFSTYLVGDPRPQLLDPLGGPGSRLMVSGENPDSTRMTSGNHW